MQRNKKKMTEELNDMLVKQEENNKDYWRVLEGFAKAIVYFIIFT